MLDLPYNYYTTKGEADGRFNSWHGSIGRGRDWLALNARARFLVAAVLAVGIAFATPSWALAPKQSFTMNWNMQPRAYAKTLVPASQFACLDQLIKLESHWNARAKNPNSTAFGIFQFLDSTWVNYHYPVRPKSPVIQIRAGLRYIKVRYGSACNALKFHFRHGWY